MVRNGGPQCASLKILGGAHTGITGLRRLLDRGNGWRGGCQGVRVGIPASDTLRDTRGPERPVRRAVRLGCEVAEEGLEPPTRGL
jgi:hypothetical protein